MNIEAQEYFDALIAKDPDSLSEPELGFLKARRGYMTKEQAAKYDFSEKPVEEAPVEPAVEPVVEEPIAPVEPIAEPVEEASTEPVAEETPLEEKKN